MEYKKTNIVLPSIFNKITIYIFASIFTLFTNCYLITNSFAALTTPKSITIGSTGFEHLIEITETVGTITLPAGSITYSDVPTRAAVKIEASITETATIDSVSIGGTIDGIHNNASKLTYTKFPAFLICATRSARKQCCYIFNCACLQPSDNFLYFKNSITVKDTGYLSSDESATFEIQTQVKGDIINNGSIIGDNCNCIQIGKDKKGDFLLAGSLTNLGTIQALNNGTAIHAIGKVNKVNKKNNIDNFKITNSGTMIGNLAFIASGADFNYQLDNKVDNINTNNPVYLTADQLLVEDASLTITNDQSSHFNIHNITLKANDKTFLTIDNKQVTKVIKLTNYKSATVNIIGGLIITDLINPLASTLTISSGKITVTRIKNSGFVHANGGMEVKNKFDNDQTSILVVDGDKLEFDVQESNNGSITANKGMIAHKDFINNKKAQLTITGSTLTFEGQGTNYGSITASGGMTANKAYYNMGGDSKLHVSGSTLTFKDQANNDGYIQSDDAVVFINQLDNKGHIVANKGLQAHKMVFNRLQATIDVNGSELYLKAKIDNAGSISANDGLTAEDHFDNKPGAKLLIAGTIANFHSTVNNSGSITANQGLTATKQFNNNTTAHLDVSGATLTFINSANNAGHISASGMLAQGLFTNKYNATLVTSNSLTICNNGLINRSHISAKAGLLVSVQFYNYATADLAVSGSTLTIKSVANNFGKLTAEAGLDAKDNMINDGNMIVTGSCIIAGKLDNSKNITANSGIIVHGAVTNKTTANIKVDGGTLTFYSTLNNSNSIEANKALYIAGKVINTGNISIAGGTSTFKAHIENTKNITSESPLITDSINNLGFINVAKYLHAKGIVTNKAQAKIDLGEGTSTFDINLINSGNIYSKGVLVTDKIENHMSIQANKGLEAKGEVVNFKEILVYDGAAIFRKHLQNEATGSIIVNGKITLASVNNKHILKANKGLTASGKANNYGDIVVNDATTTFQDDLYNTGNLTANQFLLLAAVTNTGLLQANMGLEVSKTTVNLGNLTVSRATTTFNDTVYNNNNITSNDTIIFKQAVINDFPGNITSNRALKLPKTTNSGIIYADKGLTVSGPFINTSTAKLSVNIKLATFQDVVNNAGSIITNEGLELLKEVTNTGIITSNKALTSDATLTNSLGAKLVASGGRMTLKGIVDNSGKINADRGMLAEDIFTNNKDAKLIISCATATFNKALINSGKIIINDYATITTVTNSGYLAVNKGLNVYATITNSLNANLLVFGASFTSKVLDNAGNIETNALITIDEVINAGTINTNQSLITKKFSNKQLSKLVVDGSTLTFDILDNKGDILSSGYMTANAVTNSGVLAAKDGITVTKSILNEVKARLYIDNGTLTCDTLMNKGEVNSNALINAGTAENSDLLVATKGLIIDNTFTNSANSKVYIDSGSVSFGRLINQGNINSNAIVSATEVTNSNVLTANSGLIIATTFTNSSNKSKLYIDTGSVTFGNLINDGEIQSNSLISAKETINSNVLTANSGLIIAATLTNSGNKSKIFIDKGSVTFGNLINDGEIQSNSLISAKETINSNVLTANSGLIIAVTLTNSGNKSKIFIDKGSVTFGNIINDGEIQSNSLISAKETINSNLLIANNGLIVESSFTNKTNNSKLFIDSGSVTFGNLINDGEIHSNGLIITKEIINSNLLIANNGLIVESSFTNKTNNSKLFIDRGSVTFGNLINDGEIHSNGLISTKEIINSNLLIANNGLIVERSFTNYAINSKLFIDRGSVTFDSLINHGEIHSNSLITASTVENHSILNAHNGLIVNGSFTNFSGAGLNVCGQNLTINSFMDNQGNIRSDAPVILIDGSNDGIIDIHNSLTVNSNFTNLSNSRITLCKGKIDFKGYLINMSNFITHDQQLNIAKYLNNSGNITLGNGIVVTGSITNAGNFTVAKGITTCSSLDNSGYININEGITIATDFNNKKNATFTIAGSVIINGTTDNAGSIVFKDKPYKIKHIINTGSIKTKEGITVDGALDNSGNFFVACGDIIVNQNLNNTNPGNMHAANKIIIHKDAINSGTITAKHLELSDKLTNNTKGYIEVAKLIINNKNTEIDNKTSATIRIHEAFKAGNADIINDGSLSISSYSEMNSYEGKGELAINLPEQTIPKQALLTVTTLATFTGKSAKLILNCKQVPLYLHQKKVADITILHAQNIKTDNTINNLVYSPIVKLQSILLGIASITLSQTDIRVQLRSQLVTMLGKTSAAMSGIARTLISSGATQQQQQGIQLQANAMLDEDSQHDLVNFAANSNINQLNSLLIKNLYPQMPDKIVEHFVDTSGVEHYKAVDNHNNIMSAVVPSSDKKTRHKKFFKKGLFYDSTKLAPLDTWCMLSYQVGNEDKKINNLYRDWQDKTMCFGLGSGRQGITAGLSFVYLESNMSVKVDIRNPKTHKNNTLKLGHNNLKTFLWVIHALSQFENWNFSSAIMYGRTRHESSYRDKFSSREYSIMLTTSYNKHWKELELDLGLTTRLTSIYIPQHKLAAYPNISVGYNYKDYASLGPFLAISVNHKISSKSFFNFEVTTGYLRTSGVNNKDEINLIFHTRPFAKLSQTPYIKDNIYAELRVNLVYHAMSSGFMLSWNRGREKNIYGISIFAIYAF